MLRCYNARPEPVEGAWRFGRAVERAAIVRADEHNPRPVVPADNGHTILFRAGPRAIVTLRVAGGL